MQLFVDPHVALRTRRRRRRSVAKATALLSPPYSWQSRASTNSGPGTAGRSDSTAGACNRQSQSRLPRGADALPLDGPGWQVMRPSRHRYFAHSQLIAFIESLASDVNRIGGGILVGDMALPRGGPMPTGHRSHQIGLDVDIWFEPAPRIHLLPSIGKRCRPSRWSPPMERASMQ